MNSYGAAHFCLAECLLSMLANLILCILFTCNTVLFYFFTYSDPIHFIVSGLNSTFARCILPWVLFLFLEFCERHILVCLKYSYTRRNRRLPNLWGFTDSKWIIRDLDHTFNNSFQDASYVSQPQTCRVN